MILDAIIGTITSMVGDVIKRVLPETIIADQKTQLSKGMGLWTGIKFRRDG